MAASTSQSSLPQGFSVYQPALGTQLQFFPALGSKQLDDLINACIPGSATIGEKRASVSVDFLEYAQLTGQTFKFYPVYAAAASVAASPVAASPSMDSANSSLNVSPVTSTWDWSATASISSRSSTQRRRHSKATSPSSRHQTAADFSSLPGMKILTKDGIDVTNSASRGSKTKEQRDHAHLMRIIKACDSCKRKKIRCDPSHKKRAAAQLSAQSSASGVAVPKPTKKQRTVAQSQPPPAQTQSSISPPAMVADEFASFSGSFELDSSFDFSSLDGMDAAALPCDAWDEFVQFPPMDVAEDYDFFLDPESFFSSQSSASSSSASPSKALTPQSLGDSFALPGADVDNGGDDILQTRSPQYPFLDQSGSSGSDYADFNLFSPQSSFSEDDRMLPISSSSSSLPSLDGALISEYPSSARDVAGGDDGGMDDWDGAIASTQASQLSRGDGVGGSEYHVPGPQGAEPSNRLALSGVEGGIEYYDPGSSGAEMSNRIDASGVEQTAGLGLSPGGQVVICCAPGTVVLTPDGPGSRILDNASTSLNVSGSGLTRSAASEKPAQLVSQLRSTATSLGHRNESPAVAVQDYVAAAATSAGGNDQSAVNVLHEQDLRTRPVSYRSEAVLPNGTDSGLHEPETGGARVIPSGVATAGEEWGAASNVAPDRESFVGMLVAESPGQSSDDAHNTSLASPGDLQATSVESAVDHGVTRSPDQINAATQQSVTTTEPAAVVSASEGGNDLDGLPADESASSSAVSSPISVSQQRDLRTGSVDAVSRETRFLSLAAVGGLFNAARNGSKPTPGALALPLIAVAVLSAFVLYMHRALTSASSSTCMPSAYAVGAMLVFATKAAAWTSSTPSQPTAAVKQSKEQAASRNQNLFRLLDAPSSTRGLPRRTLAAVRSHVSRSISQGSVTAIPIMTSLQG